MDEALPVIKTHKLFIGGAFPRSESGRSIAVTDGDGAVACYVAHASRKDLRSGVEAARGAFAGWSARTAYNRGQVLYRMAEMLESRRSEFAEGLSTVVGAPALARSGGVDAEGEVRASVDRLVAFAGWADKFAQVLGCQNPVAGAYHNFTIPEATGVVAVVCPESPALLAMVSLLAPVICTGNTAVVVASARCPVMGALLGEVCIASDVPAGVVNVLTTNGDELNSWIAGHREVDAVVGSTRDDAVRRALRAGAAENLKRVTMYDRREEEWFEAGVCESPATLEATVEFKTMWHPARV